VLSKPTTTDANYAAKDPLDVTLTNDDNDSAGFFITVPMDVTTYEDQTLPAVQFKVVLTSKPKGTVTLPLVSSNETEGTVSAPSPAELVFDASDWFVEQTVTVQGADDLLVDMDTMYSIEVGPPQSVDKSYSVLPAQSVNFINQNDDVP
jgi:hypothetical protein